MNEPAQISSRHWILVGVALALYGCHVVYAVVSNRFFYPDGTQYFVHILATGDYAAWLWPRNWADHVLEFPLVMAVRGGVTDVWQLGWIRGATIMAPPLVSLLICFLAAPRDRKYVFLIPLLSHFAAAVNTEFFLHTANRFLVSSGWAVAFLVMYRRSWLAWSIAGVVAVPMLRTYEGAFVLAPLLLGVCVWRGRQEMGARRWVMVGMAVWFGITAVVAARFVFWPNDPTSFLTFTVGVLAVVDENLYPHFGVMISLMVLSLLMLRQCRPAWRLTGQGWSWGLVGSAGLLFMLLPWVWPQAVAPETHQQLRSMNVYVPAVLLVILWGYEAGRWKIRPDVWRLGYGLVGMLGIAQSVWNMEATAQWNRYVEVFRAELDRLPNGLVRFQDTRLAELPERYQISAGMHCDWSPVFLSVLLTPNPEVRTIIAHSYENVFKPLDPRNPTELPDLSGVGINYGSYLQALSESPPVVIPDRELPDWLKWLEANFNRRLGR
jgi:hypothetical protein